MKRQFIIPEIMLGVVVLDLIKFLTIGGVTIVNWYSSIHPAWVFLAIVLLFISANNNGRALGNALLGLYLVMFFASYINQYVGFTSALTYNWMLFSGVFAVAHYLTAGKRRA